MILHEPEGELKVFRQDLTAELYGRMIAGSLLSVINRLLSDDYGTILTK